MTVNLHFIFGDQLSHSISCLQQCHKKDDVIFMCEVIEEITYVKHHCQKIILVLSAMRHFAKELKQKGYRVDYVRLDDTKNTGSFDKEIQRAIKRHHPQNIFITEPSEYRVMEKIKRWQRTLKTPINVITDNRFFCSRSEFKEWAGDKKQLRMEFFYREMRRQHNILMTKQGKPEGGQWNYDKDNRKPLKDNINIPNQKRIPPDKITNDIIKMVKAKFNDHFGNIDRFDWAVDRKSALSILSHFLKKQLIHFGDYQDAMQTEQAFLFHSTISPYLNMGLLNPKEVCQKAIAAYQNKEAPLNAVEGFIRQILGWREFIRGIYWLKMPEYKDLNYFKTKRNLPEFYWTGNTDMNCLKQAIQQTQSFAYAHHIQRLMVTGNFALLAGVDTQKVCEWYLIVYADAFEWVELPNTLGMALFGDGGIVGSKPYAASGKYIERMSNYCQDCRYSPKETIGDNACPYNYLFWHFLENNKKALKDNNRLGYVYANWSRMTKTKKDAILKQAKSFLKKLN